MGKTLPNYRHTTLKNFHPFSIPNDLKIGVKVSQMTPTDKYKDL